MPKGGNKLQLTFMAVASLAIAYFPGTFGALFTVTNIGSWYATIEKPALNPPNWVFGPVWNILYLLIGIALFLVWREIEKKKSLTSFDKLTFIIVFVQLALNGLWSLVFFGFESPLYGLVIISSLIVAIIANIVVFWRYKKLAALLLIPYLLWVSFATYLNAAIYLLN